MDHQRKKLTIVRLEDKYVMRVDADFARLAVASGDFAYTRKRKLKAFFNMENTVRKNLAIVNSPEFAKETDNIIRNEGNKVVAYLLRKRIYQAPRVDKNGEHSLKGTAKTKKPSFLERMLTHLGLFKKEADEAPVSGIGYGVYPIYQRLVVGYRY